MFETQFNELIAEFRSALNPPGPTPKLEPIAEAT